MNTIKTISDFCRSFLHFFLIALFFLYSYHSFAQEDLPCANEIFQTKQLEDTGFVRQLLTIQQANNSTNLRINGTILEIPIVVHVLHLGEPIGTGTNIPDQQIYDAVQGANERWRRQNTTDGVDMEVQFCLAQFNPDGNPSNGIVRVDASGIPLYSEKGIGYIEALLVGEVGADEIQIKNLSNWRHDYVYNIWVVNKIAGGWGGYAFFPLGGNYATDGVVITTNSIRYTSSTLAHELGHGMGLFHTFQGSENGCPANDICFLLGDWVCDTPPHKKTDCTNSNCNNDPDSMNSFKNIMSYCSGRGLFTQGQKDRVRTSILNTTRSILVRSYACSGKPCDTARTLLTAQTCIGANAGIAYDTLSTSKGCDSIVKITTTLIPETVSNFTSNSNGQIVTFSNISQNAISYTWQFGDDSTSNEISPMHTYLSGGTFNVKLIVEGTCNSDTAETSIILQNTGIKTQTNTPKLSIYPNPNNGNFTLIADVKTNKTTYLEITNVLGQTIVQQELFAGKEHILSLSTKLPKGLYQLLLKEKGKIIDLCTLNVY